MFLYENQVELNESGKKSNKNCDFVRLYAFNLNVSVWKKVINSFDKTAISFQVVLKQCPKDAILVVTRSLYKFN